MPRIAIFTKNRTNPAYDAARLGADRVAARLGATTTHYVPDEPDSVPEQIALIARAIATRPDAAVFVPVHETAVNDAVRGFDAAGISLFNIITRTTAGRRVTFVGSDDRALARDIARYLFAKLSGAARSSLSKARRVGDQPRAAQGLSASRRRSILTSRCGCRCAAIISAMSRARSFMPCSTGGKASTRCCAPTTPWRSACWMRSTRSTRT